jgi:hypothetical protein
MLREISKIVNGSIYPVNWHAPQAMFAMGKSVGSTVPPSLVILSGA